MSPWADQQAGVAELAAPDNPLVTVRDYCERYGLTLPSSGDPLFARIETELEVASSVVRLTARGRVFTPTDNDVVVVNGTGAERFMLPHALLPIRTVASIVDADAGTDPVDPSAYSWSSDGIVERVDGGRWTALRRGLTVVCDHGYLVIPRAVEGVVMSLAKRLLDSPGGSQVQQESVGGFSVTYATGNIGLTELEAKVLERAGGGGR